MGFVILQWVASIDLNANEDADANVTVKMTESFTEQASQVTSSVLPRGSHLTADVYIYEFISIMDEKPKSTGSLFYIQQSCLRHC